MMHQVDCPADPGVAAPVTDIACSFNDDADAPVLTRQALGALAGLAAFDFLAPGMLFEINHAVPMAAVLGIGAGQLPLLAVWTVLGPPRFWRRWLGALAMVCVLYASVVAGMAAAAAERAQLQLFSVNLFALPLVFLTAQFPLWLLRVGLGRGMSRDAGERRQADGGAQFRVRDLLTVFVVVGAGLGLSRLAIALHAMDGAEDGIAPWLYLALACTLFGVWSALLALPCVWAAFLARRRAAANSVVVSYVLLLALGAAAVLTLGGAALPAEELAALFAFSGGSLLVILSGCQLLREWGYSLPRQK